MMTFVPFSDGFAFSQEEHGQVSQVKLPYILFRLFEATCLALISLYLHRTDCKVNENKVNGKMLRINVTLREKILLLSDSLFKATFLFKIFRIIFPENFVS